MMEKIQVNAFTSMSVGAADGRLYLFVEGSEETESVLMDIDGAETLLAQLTVAVGEARQQAHLPPDEVALTVALKPEGVQLKLLNPRTRMGVRSLLGRADLGALIAELRRLQVMLPVGVG